MADYKNPISGQNVATPTQPSKIRRISDGCFSSQLCIPASPFMKKLGFGTGVAVYLYERSPKGGFRSPWAIKKVKARTKSLGKEMAKRLKKEADILKQLDHINIVGYRGFSHSADGGCCLSMENGEKSLLDIIEAREESGQGAFGAKDIYKVAWSVVDALNYLHNKKKILHGDLKSGNILICGDFDLVKLCDFGVSLKLNDDLSDLENEYDTYIGSEPWKCKEAIEGAIITDKADMFAYGLIIWEMMSLSIPHMDLLPLDSSSDSFDVSFCEDMYNAALGSRPPLPDEERLLNDIQYQPLIELFHMCTNENPQDRPSAVQALIALTSIKEDGVIAGL